MSNGRSDVRPAQRDENGDEMVTDMYVEGRGAWANERREVIVIGAMKVENALGVASLAVASAGCNVDQVDSCSWLKISMAAGQLVGCVP